MHNDTYIISAWHMLHSQYKKAFIMIHRSWVEICDANNIQRDMQNMYCVKLYITWSSKKNNHTDIQNAGLYHDLYPICYFYRFCANVLESPLNQCVTASHTCSLQLRIPACILYLFIALTPLTIQIESTWTCGGFYGFKITSKSSREHL